MPENPWQQQFQKLLARASEEFKRTSDDLKVEAQRLLGRARSELEFLRPGVLLESLEARLASLQKTCRDVGEALALEYFYSAPWVAWTDAGRNGSLVIEEGEI